MTQNPGSGIAGSYALQAFGKLQWHDSDIDVWVPVKRVNRVLAGLLLAGYGVPSRMQLDVHHEYMRLQRYIRCAYVLKLKNSPDVQVLVYNPGYSLADMVASFDLTICMVTYDGREFHTKPAHFGIANNQLVIGDVCMAQQSLYEWIRTLRCIMKYTKRGFAVPTLKNWQRLMRTRGSVFESGVFAFTREFTNFWNRTVYPVVEETPLPVFYHTATHTYMTWQKHLIYANRTMIGDADIVETFDERIRLPAPADLYSQARIPDQCFDVTYDTVASGQYLESLSTGIIITTPEEESMCFDILTLRRALDGTAETYYSYHSDPETKLMNGREWTIRQNEMAKQIIPVLEKILRKCRRDTCDVAVTGEQYRAFAQELWPFFSAGVSKFRIHRPFMVKDDRPESVVEAMRNCSGFLQMQQHLLNTKFRKSGKIAYNMDNTVFYECESDGQFRIPYYLLRLTRNFLVTLSDVRRMILDFYNHKKRAFRILPLNDASGVQISLTKTMNHGLVRQRGSAVSADHCQLGSNKLVYRIVTVQ